jgi:cellulose synthase/poly-beta-1,6-N-acetylglucosamine synthase-like glycosyltransferase
LSEPALVEGNAGLQLIEVRATRDASAAQFLDESEAATFGPADDCLTHRYQRTGSAAIHTFIRWSGLTIIVVFMLALPFLYFRYHLWLKGPYLRMAELGIISGVVGWFLGRPLVVRLASRRALRHRSRAQAGVSVVVPCHNAAAKLPQTLGSLLAQTVRPIEILFVENNSTDSTLEVLRRLERDHPEVRAFSVKTRPGEYAASVAVNYGVSQATHDIIVRMDDDTVMAPETVAEAIPPLVNGEAVATACNLRVANVTRSLWTRLQAFEYMFAMELDRRSQALVQSVLCCSGGLAVFLRATVVKAGGFCSMPRWVSEDIDMTMKHHRFGLIAVRPKAVGYTAVPETLWQLVRQRYRWAISGTVALYLHRRGLARSRYWYDGRVGFFGLPLRVIMALRDLASPLYGYYLAVLFVRGGAVWLAAILLAQMALTGLQILILASALHSRQGARYWFLIPLFTLVYGPVLLAVRFAGTWAGLSQVVALRRKEDRLQHAGLAPGRGRAVQAS